MKEFAYVVSGGLLMLAIIGLGPQGTKLAEYQDVIKSCEQKLLQENAPRSIVCKISAVNVDTNQINGDKK